MFWSGLVASGGTRNVGFHFLRAAGEILSKKKQRGELKKGLKREIHEGWRIKRCTFVFTFLQRSLKPNQSNRAEGQNWHVARAPPPTSPCSAVLYNNIFFHRRRTCLITLFIRDEARLRSTALPPFLTAVSVRLGRPMLGGMAQGKPTEKKKRRRGKRAHAPGLRCGIWCQRRPRFFHPRVILYSEIGFPATKPLSPP